MPKIRTFKNIVASILQRVVKSSEKRHLTQLYGIFSNNIFKRDSMFFGTMMQKTKRNRI